ncbi:conserved exported protein of unknown function [Hyphomicrobium sp. 1Nfss2.1]|uniref:hypothetical protein n=1 Tax=Hyphomicrobium sp. 1Nfss2.1 TaxID=3413936 RepID=UPI003C7B5796
MPTTLFSILGLVFSALSLFSASFLANVAADIDNRRDAYAALATQITRKLADDWKLSSIAPHYAEEALRELSPVLDADAPELRSLGPLVRAENIQVEPHWARPLGTLSAGKLAERLAELINRSVGVQFVGKFAGGEARVTAELKREGGRTKLWRLRIDGLQAPPPHRGRPDRRVVSYA